MAGEGIIRGTLESNLNLNLLVQPSTLSPILVLSPSHYTYDAVDLQRSLKMVTPTPSLYSLKKKPSESSTVTIQSAANSIHTVSDDATVFDDKESTPKVTLPYSIFSPAQKRSIVLVVGAAALFSSVLPLPPQIRQLTTIQQTSISKLVLPLHTHYRTRLESLGRTCQSHHHCIHDLPRHHPKFLGCNLRCRWTSTSLYHHSHRVRTSSTPLRNSN